MRLLITGSRGWHDEGAIEAVIAEQMEWAKRNDEEFVLIHGHAKSGADALADKAGRRLGLVVGRNLIRVPADWKRHGRAAGPIRNQRMLNEQYPDVVIGFRAAGKSNGTDDMLAKAVAGNVPTHVYHEHAPTPHA